MENTKDTVVGYDKNPKLMNRKKFNKAKNIESNQ